MDISQIINMPGVYDSARISGEQSALNNQLVQQKVQALIEEAKRAQEMQPTELAMKNAMAQDYLARANATGHYAKVTPEEKQAKAEELRRLMQGRASRGYLETAMTLPEGRNAYLEKVLPQLREDIRPRLSPDESTRLFMDDNINRIIQQLREEDPEAGKYLRTDLTGQYGITRQGMIGEEKEKDRQLRRDLASMDNEIKQKIAESRKTPKELYNQYQQTAEALEAEGRHDEADKYYAMARRTALLSAMTKPGASQESVDIGKAGGLPTTTPVAPAANQPERDPLGLRK